VNPAQVDHDLYSGTKAHILNQEEMNEKASKAAIILLALGGSFGSRLMKEFEPDEIKQFAASAASINEVDQAFLDSLIEEFSSEMDRPELLRGGDIKTRDFLTEALPADQFNKLLGEEAEEFVPVWQKFTAGSENTLAPYLLDEHPQTITFILTKLDIDLSARIISLLPRDLRDSVTRRLLKLQPVNDETSRLVQSCLQADLLTQADNGLEKEGRTRMATLLNKMDKEQVEVILESLNAVRPAEAAALRKLLFSFEDILKLEQKYRLILFDKVQTEQVMLALRGVEAGLKETILSSLGARARRMIEAELNGAEVEVTKEVAAARRSIAETALKLASTGEIIIAEPEPDAVVKEAS
jgi:flagellar motor switch protein FliG